MKAWLHALEPSSGHIHSQAARQSGLLSLTPPASASRREVLPAVDCSLRGRGGGTVLICRDKFSPSKKMPTSPESGAVQGWFRLQCRRQRSPSFLPAPSIPSGEPVSDPPQRATSLIEWEDPPSRQSIGHGTPIWPRHWPRRSSRHEPPYMSDFTLPGDSQKEEMALVTKQVSGCTARWINNST